ncbi:hypothetical protein NDU88_006163 [Pleurodeles waltl]|uniref:Uncharacterized protein n=1 Tax=Pleurodeles waltl TaxID=8319 RepID=A0AAV7WXE2_PLEWA|nr:hypothetical protein NDU88_006163 [Pleurodeles waltl]
MTDRVPMNLRAQWTAEPDREPGDEGLEDDTAPPGRPEGLLRLGKGAARSRRRGPSSKTDRVGEPEWLQLVSYPTVMPAGYQMPVERTVLKFW